MIKIRQQLVNELLKNPNKKYYNLSNDYLFKKVFSDVDLLKLLLSDMFDENIKYIKILSPLLLKHHKNMYAGLVDLIIETDDGIKLLELQNKDRHNFFRRLIFYSSALIHMYCLKNSQDFDKLKKFECLAIVNFNISKKKLKNIKLRTEENEEITNHIKANIFNLKRDKCINETEKLFGFETGKDLAKICKTISEKYLILIKLIIIYNRKDEEKLREIEELFINEKKNDMKRERNYGISIGEKRGEKRGISIGEKRGISKEKESIARNMIEKNMDINLISELTNLSKNKILSLK